MDSGTKRAKSRCLDVRSGPVTTRRRTQRRLRAPSSSWIRSWMRELSRALPGRGTSRRGGSLAPRAVPPPLPGARCAMLHGRRAGHPPTDDGGQGRTSGAMIHREARVQIHPTEVDGSGTGPAPLKLPSAAPPKTVLRTRSADRILEPGSEGWLGPRVAGGVRPGHVTGQSGRGGEAYSTYPAGELDVDDVDGLAGHRGEDGR